MRRLSFDRVLGPLAGIAMLTAPVAEACTRAVYLGPQGQTVTGRSLDWPEDMRTNLWFFPRGMARDGGLDSGALEWTSLYGSVVASVYEGATATRRSANTSAASSGSTTGGSIRESTFSPGVVWVRLADLDYATNSGVRKLQLDGEPDRDGNQTDEFRPAEPFRFLRLQP